jgi:hypothetical protein
MKILKLIPVAVALLTLASCSNDELFGEGQAPTQKVKDGLTVAVDDIAFDGAAVATRQGNTAAGGVVWQNGDQINVYDGKLQLFDEYAFKTNKFVGINDPDETNLDGKPEYALFPAKRVDYAGNKKAVMTIPELVIYDEESEFGEGAGRVYVSNLPLWGSADGTYPEASVNLHFLTSVLRINIKNAFADNINFLKVEAQDGVAIQGAFEADLSDPANAVLKQGSSSLTTGNVMYVDLRGVPSYMTYLYLPIIAREYDYLKVYTTAETVEATPIEANSKQIVNALKAIPAAKWDCIRNWEADGGITFEAGKGKSLYKETQYNLENVNTTEELSEALKMYAADYLSKADRDQTQDPANLTLNISSTTNKGLAVTRTSENYKDDYTIYIPKFPDAIKTVTINIPDGISAGTDVDLQIVDANIKECYNGKVIINATKINDNDMAMTVNLPATSLTIDGDFSTTKKLTKLNIKNVKDMTFGVVEETPVPTKIDASTVVTVNNANSVTIAGDCEFNAGLDLVETENIANGGVTIEEGGEYTGTGAKALKVLDANVRVLGTAKTIYQFASKGTIYIGATEAGDGLSNGEVYYIGTIGKVYIANKEESEAITNELSLLGNNTVTLKQGYIKKIGYSRYMDFNNSSSKYYVKALADLTTSDKDAKVITIKLDEIFCGTPAAGVKNQGLTAIAEIDANLLSYDGGKYNFVKMTTSKWGGQTIDGTTFAAYVGADALAKVYTASELASINDIAAKDNKVALHNNIDLNSKTWTNPVMKNSFTGLDPRFVDASTDKANLNTNEKGQHTIKNLYLDNSTNTAKQENFGLFGEVKGNEKRVFDNFVLDGVTSNLVAIAAKAPSNVGAIVGKLSETRERQFKNITVKNAAIGGAASYGSAPTTVGIRNIGALIGLAVDGDAVKAITISDNNIAAAITGQAYMGGLIGKDESTSNVTITKNTVNTTFSVPSTLIPENDDQVNKNFGTVGNAVGQFENTTATLTIAADNTFTDNVTGHRQALGFKYNFIVSKAITDAKGYMAQTTGDEVKYAFYGGNPYVGYSPNFTDEKLIIGTQKYKKTVYICDSNATDAKGFKKLKKDSPAFTQNAYIQWTPWAE